MGIVNRYMDSSSQYHPRRNARSYTHGAIPAQQPQSLPITESGVALEKQTNGQNVSPIPPENVENPILKVCLTGGPCGGKTSGLSYIGQRLTQLGYKVFYVPEIATYTIQGGGEIIANPGSSKNAVRIQGLIVKTQMQMEDYFEELAMINGKPSVVLCDRGVLDPRAYLTADEFNTMLDHNGWTVGCLRDMRYDLVIHFITAADGASDFYTSENNIARHESLDEAIEMDRKTQQAWVGHPNLRIIDNETTKGFDAKINRAFACIGCLLGIPTPSMNERKFLIDKSAGPTLYPSHVRREVIFVEEIFIQQEKPNTTCSIRKYGQNGAYSYDQNLRFKQEGQVVNKKKRLTQREYEELCKYQDKSTGKIVKERVSFLCEKNHFIHDKFLNVDDGVEILRVETDQINLKLPPYLKIEKEITNVPFYSSFELSKRVVPYKE
eukprot:TRINITY_DN5782_c0_g1_i2.p1 TRINITY_DN5782_c0_g1~~TRINITY_DN5782_c0_g1_i2.p1  ORF type:complete len:474 (+),score=88.91 TRINITY_DN5782_c0_g1_i2:114-1424(+)